MVYELEFYSHVGTEGDDSNSCLQLPVNIFPISYERVGGIIGYVEPSTGNSYLEKSFDICESDLRHHFAGRDYLK